MGVADRFSDSYEQARDRFRAAAAAHPAAGDQGSLDVLDGFTIDWAWTGDADAGRVQVFSTGLHGVEGYAGGAAALEMLEAGDETPTLWLHALNPWGMAHWRRVNEENVDLNRNFLADGAPYEADDEAYGAFDELLNPVHRSRIDPFLLRTVLLILRHGMPALRNVVARGQYSFPRGLFFGGARRQATARLVLEHAVPRLQGRERVVWIDLHTGRGKPGEVVAFLDGVPSPDTTARPAAPTATRCGAACSPSWPAAVAPSASTPSPSSSALGATWASSRRCGPRTTCTSTAREGRAAPGPGRPIRRAARWPGPSVLPTPPGARACWTTRGRCNPRWGGCWSRTDGHAAALAE